jgi:hypothetical protein
MVRVRGNSEVGRSACIVDDGARSSSGRSVGTYRKHERQKVFSVCRVGYAFGGCNGTHSCALAIIILHLPQQYSCVLLVGAVTGRTR